jgi:hydrogenase nickel incorporation protein HypA/HybF
MLEKALQKANEAGADRIADVHLVLGEISSYTEESIRSLWDEVSRGTSAENAKLHFRHVRAEVQCMACFTKYHPANGEIVCPNCRSVGAKILAGEEFFMEGLDLA